MENPGVSYTVLGAGTLLLLPGEYRRVLFFCSFQKVVPGPLSLGQDPGLLTLATSMLCRLERTVVQADTWALPQPRGEFLLHSLHAGLVHVLLALLRVS